MGLFNRVRRRAFSADRETARDREGLSILEGLLAKVPFLSGKLVEETIGAGGAAAIPHKLGKTPTGWILFDITGSDSEVTRTGWTDKTITLLNNGAASVTVKVWVF